MKSNTLICQSKFSKTINERYFEASKTLLLKVLFVNVTDFINYKIVVYVTSKLFNYQGKCLTKIHNFSSYTNLSNIIFRKRVLILLFGTEGLSPWRINTVANKKRELTLCLMTKNILGLGNESSGRHSWRSCFLFVKKKKEVGILSCFSSSTILLPLFILTFYIFEYMHREHWGRKSFLILAKLFAWGDGVTNIRIKRCDANGFQDLTVTSIQHWSSSNTFPNSWS